MELDTDILARWLRPWATMAAYSVSVFPGIGSRFDRGWGAIARIMGLLKISQEFQAAHVFLAARRAA